MLVLFLACKHPPDAPPDARIVGVSRGYETAPDDRRNRDPYAVLTGADDPAIRWEPADPPTTDVSTVDLAGAQWLKIELRADPDEGLYGLGEVFGSVNHRGTSQAMQIEADATVESGYNEVHVPVPFLVGSSGWGVGVPNDWPMAWDVAAAAPDRVVVLIATPDPVEVDLFEGEPSDVIAAWTRRAGLPRRPPDWALAPMFWRDEDVGQDVVLADAIAARENDLAFGVTWIDNDWQTTWNSMVPDPALFPDWDAMVAELDRTGFRWLAWTTPYLEPADPEHADYDANGLLVDLPIAFNDIGDLVDLTSPDGSARWTARARAAADRGVNGWKLDFGEDLQLGYGAIRFTTPLANGADERSMHHRFAERYHRAYADAYDDDDRFLLGRAGAWGTSALTDCIWPGDLDPDFQDRVDGHVGGLPVAIRAGTNLSVSGFPCFASDVGGYLHDRPSADAMIRWTEYAATLPVMQVGGAGGDHVYWAMNADWGADVLAAGQRYTRLHLRLLPFFRTLLEQAATQGSPVVLPTGLVGGAHVDDEFLVGGTLLVAPITTADATSRTVAFPPGRWIHWWTGAAYEGEVDVPAPLGAGPLFVRQGGVVPLLRDTVRTATAAEGVDSWATDRGVLTLRVVPGPGSFAVLEGPEVTVTSDAVVVTAPDSFDGVALDLWAPGATELLRDGVIVPSTTDGTWLTGAQGGAGRYTWR